VPAENLPSSHQKDQTQSQSGSPVNTVLFHLRRFFRSPRNIFGLSRTYSGVEPPIHDAEEEVSRSDLSKASPEVSDFHPFTNESSFLLSEWYWKDSTQKSQTSFRDLINIIGRPEFCPADIQETKWDRVNSSLADGDEWADEDAGWKRDHVSIAVPFHSLNKNPGTQEYVVADFYHRPLVSVIREKLANVADGRLFHYEPYELRWLPPNKHNDIRVHGELYTSQVFIDTHRELQNFPREPSCNLPRVIVAMMFWSDTTHLTSFRHSKLWRPHLCFGNESKYRRRKPSSKLCNHVAYFQKVDDFL
jgi:hypothetical protein